MHSRAYTTTPTGPDQKDWERCQQINTVIVISEKEIKRVTTGFGCLSRIIITGISIMVLYYSETYGTTTTDYIYTTNSTTT